MTDAGKAREIRLSTPRGSLTALHWANPGAPRVLALHGWLDNAASHAPLSRHLGEVDLVALDFAGHGHSDHLPPGLHYYFFDYLTDIEGALDALEWDNAALLGHSLGGALACCYSAGSPERVERLVALDALGPLTEPPDHAGDRLRRAMAHLRRQRRSAKLFETVDEAVTARLHATPMEQSSCKTLCERSLGAVEGGWKWRTDRRLKWVSPFMLTEPQVLNILEHIECPTLMIGARPLPPFIKEEWIKGRLNAISKISTHTVQGGHHFHMDQPDEIAGIIKPFLEGATEP